VARTLAAVPDLDEELDRLYGGPLESFTPTRNDLARRLQKAGQADAAERIRALKKPSVPVWTVNQLARRNEQEVAALVRAGEQLRRAQAQALGGSDADALREATAAERDAIRRLTHEAQAFLRGEERSASQQVLERVAATLRAAAVDPDAARLLATGRLAGELDSPGFAAVAELAPTPRRGVRKSATSTADTRRRDAERRKLVARIERLERTFAAQDEHARRAEATADELRARAESAKAELDEARRALERL
jgi:hypothetical protein